MNLSVSIFHPGIFFTLQLLADSFVEFFIFAAPLNQKYICQDRVNITLQNSKQQRLIVEMEPEVSIQPYNVQNRHANLYVCERTKRRTLTESFNNRMTVFSGIVLGISSVSMLKFLIKLHSKIPS
ncbi:unnamed protein product [Enterobius vermicularis]|uniref:GOLD domain-containing protein n=1 Tax=Enterobius vermicularis TaxID=51028 RepID=A0A0N4VKA7_ENTVE|nr:unnamed protein product [Enterobius vermicularis]